MVGADILGRLEPKLRRLIKHLAFEWHRRQHFVERRLAVGRDHHLAAIGEVIGVAHFAAVKAGQFGKLGIGQALAGKPGATGVVHEYLSWLRYSAPSTSTKVSL